MASVKTLREDGVLVVSIDNPPVNALGADIRRELLAAIRDGEADPAVHALIVRAKGGMFSGGADIREFGSPSSEPALPELILAVESCVKPVIAAIHGSALGGGLELALGCHYRVAEPSARFGLPEVKLGLLPGAGGTQRLPRLIGIEAALDMITTGEPIDARAALELGLVDVIAGDEGLDAAALALATQVADKGPGARVAPREDKIVGTPLELFQRYREQNATKLKNMVALRACVIAVEAAATLPLAEGLALERSLFQKLASSSQSSALRHAFFAERAAARVEGIDSDTATLPVARVGIIGAGTMGAGIAMCFLSAGFQVRLVEMKPEALDKGVARITGSYDDAVRKGRLDGDAAAKAAALLAPTLKLEDLADCDLVIEAVFELMEIKKEIFARLDTIAGPNAILATNTSYLDIDEIAATTKRPEQVLGLHFFSPANLMKLLEVVRGAKTSPAVLATAMALAKRIGKVAVVSGVCDGFIGNRMLAARQPQAYALLLEGASPVQIDQVLVDFGFPMGPLQMADLAGLDIGWNPATTSSATIREVLCERGRKGQKSGQGFYNYGPDRKRSPSPEIEAIVGEFAARAGVAQRSVPDEEILERLLYPMINEGALILEERIAQRASDIDVVWINGYGWPRWAGGPMFWADQTGLATIVAGLERHAAHLGDRPIAASLRENAAEGRKFNG